MYFDGNNIMLLLNNFAWPIKTLAKKSGKRELQQVGKRIIKTVDSFSSSFQSSSVSIRSASQLRNSPEWI